MNTKDVALGLDALRRGCTASEVLESVAFNLGLRPFGVVGYEPLDHDLDTGGMWPGALVVVVARGWKCGTSMRGAA